MSEMQTLGNVIFGKARHKRSNNAPNPNTRPGHCLDCWDMPGLDINCGGGVETCRHCDGTGQANKRPFIEIGKEFT